jgi:VNT family MFS transporter (synaptic vesicle glycoprotein 2)
VFTTNLKSRTIKIQLEPTTANIEPLNKNHEPSSAMLNPSFSFTSHHRPTPISLKHHNSNPQGNEAKTIAILNRIYKTNTGKTNLNIHKLKPNDEFNESFKSTNVVTMMLRQTTSLCKSHPRSILILSLLQFGIYFVCNGMLLFFPDILNQTAKFVQHSGNATDTRLCTIVESAIREQRLQQKSACVDELDISSYYYAMLLEVCYVVGFLIISWLVNYTGRLAIFAFIFFTTSFCGFAVNFSGTMIGTYLYVWLLASGINNTLLNTVTYDLFPTNLRSLAMSISLMFGRLGALVGVNVAGFLLEEYCGATFTLSGVVLLLSGVLTFFIPNIIKKK